MRHGVRPAILTVLYFDLVFHEKEQNGRFAD